MSSGRRSDRLADKRHRRDEPTVRSVAGLLQDDARDLDPKELAAIALKLLAEPGEGVSPGFGVVVFGAFAFDTQTGRLQHDGQAMDLPIPEREILRHLIINRARHVPADELAMVAWPSGRGHASNVRSAIGALRRRLGDSGLIESRRSVGYRFAGTVRGVGETA